MDTEPLVTTFSTSVRQNAGRPTRRAPFTVLPYDAEISDARLLFQRDARTVAKRFHSSLPTESIRLAR